jgi:dehydrogenase/reductase SDR family member 7B
VNFNFLPLKNKTVVITGGSSGIGKALAIRYAKAGANVVITGRNSNNLIATGQELNKYSTVWHTIVSDVSIYSDCEKMIEEVIKKFGSIDVLVNNAGLSMRASFTETNIEVLKKLMDVNFWGTVYCTKFALPHLIKSKGSLVGISSIAGKKGLPGRTGYSASKFAIEGFLETIRIEHLKDNLHVLIARPGFTASAIRTSSLMANGEPQKESPRTEEEMMSADSVAEKIYNAIQHRRRDLVLTFTGKLTVFFNKFIPRIMDRLVYQHMAEEPGSPFK